jgi:uncharacterized protein (DUF302 family)
MGSMRGYSFPLTALVKIGAGIFGAMPLTSISTASGISEDAVRIESAFSFPDTMARLRSTLESRGFRIFAVIDHRAAAESVGLTMPPTMVLIHGNPKGGTPLMLAAPDFAVELPLRVLIREGMAAEP